jgi:hypothetical protein
MPCYRPIRGYRSRELTEKGKRPIVFSSSRGFLDMPVTIPCGQCIGCRLERSRQWAMRCLHEASLYDQNCFITLTYNPEHLPSDRSLHMEDFQKFMKRLRRKFGNGIRFFHCGEYGSKNNRPHYHALLFNFDFPDRNHIETRLGNKYYTSEILNELWTDEKGESIGFSLIGDVTFQSAAYVARYITKKVTGEKAENHYLGIDFETGECWDKKPEYVTMSRRPGIGKAWFDKHKNDVYPDDHVIINGKEMKPPKYYDKLLEEMVPSDYRVVKAKREKASELFSENNTYERLRTRERVQDLKFKKLIRSYEDEQC